MAFEPHCFRFCGRIGLMIRTPLTSTATSLTGFPVSLSISSSQDLGKETALLVPTWIIFLIMGAFTSPPVYHL